MKKTILFLIIAISYQIQAQITTKKALFIGNSYTYVNDLPKMLQDAAKSVGDSLIYDSNTIGGYKFSQHCTNTTTLNKIATGNWDYVVLQEQSQLPSFPDNQVATEVYPFAKRLDSLINVANPCTETMFYMTWGRKNGDAANCGFFPPLCTYEGMDSMLRLRYEIMAFTNFAELAPVGAVWRYLRQNYPSIELYDADESHPSVAGTYAAACCFYASIFRKDPTLITYIPTIPAIDAQNIRNAAKLIVFDDLISWNIGEYDPFSNFNFTQNALNVNFSNNSTGYDDFKWLFGDGDSSNTLNPTHLYSASGTYQVSLIVSKCGKIDTFSTQITLSSSTILKNKSNFNIYPNPAKNYICIESEQNLQNVQVKIYDLLGKCISNQIIADQKFKHEITIDLNSGLYLIELEKNKSKIFSHKLIIN